VKTTRLHALQALVDRQFKGFNAATVGRTVDVLVEKPGRHPGQLGGKSPYLQAVHFEGAGAAVGEIVPVRITGTSTNSLTGERVGAAQPARMSA
jgi:tRNA-2-methylthio-N6-dimethylallyladenosine synthase